MTTIYLKGASQASFVDAFPGGVYHGAQTVTAVPSVIADSSSITTAFGGDLSKVQFAVDHRISGAASLTQPTTGYAYTAEAYPHYTYLYNSSGHNQNTGSNVGRTAACAYRTMVYHVGDGDAVAYNASGFVSGTKAGSTHWLANPAVVLFNGGTFAGADGVFLNVMELDMDDHGYDCAAFGPVMNFKRTNDTGAKGAVWDGIRLQSTGSKSCNAMYSGSGKWITGLDLAMVDFATAGYNTAISLAANQRIALNNVATADSAGAKFQTTTFNDTYLAYSSALTAITAVIAGTTALQLSATAATFATTGGTQFNVANVASAVNYLVAHGAATGAPGKLTAAGNDTDIDIYFGPKGAGLVKFGTVSASGDVAVNGYVTIKSAAGATVKLATIA